MKLAHESKYHIIVLLIYLALCSYFFFFTDSPSSYFIFEKSDLGFLFPLLLAMFGSLVIGNWILKYGKLTIRKETPKKIALTILYAAAFSVPEEILFRGIIQTKLFFLFENIALAIFLSSLVYGFAHILNGASGYKPRDWNWRLVGITYIAGLFLGFSYYISGSLILPMILHTLLIIINQAFVKRV